MELPQGCEFTYIVGHEAWYAEANRAANPDPYLSVMARYPGDGHEWEFTITEHDLAVRVSMFDNSFDAFAQAPEFFAALTRRAPSSLRDVREILDELGARDATDRGV